MTYGQLARATRLPGGARAAGRAMAACPRGQGIPWHRVLAAGGRIAVREPFAGLQRRLLESEGVRLVNGHVPLAEHLWAPPKGSPKRSIKRRIEETLKISRASRDSERPSEPNPTGVAAGPCRKNERRAFLPPFLRKASNVLGGPMKYSTKPTFPYRSFILLALSLACSVVASGCIGAARARVQASKPAPQQTFLSPFSWALVQIPWQEPLPELFPERGKGPKSCNSWP